MKMILVARIAVEVDDKTEELARQEVIAGLVGLPWWNDDGTEGEILSVEIQESTIL